MKKFLTNYIFRFLFKNFDRFKDGDILVCQDDIFIFDDKNGNSNELKRLYHINGFWNYICAKPNSIYNIEKQRFLLDTETNSQGYLGLEYYKNGFELATQQEIELYNNARNI